MKIISFGDAKVIPVYKHLILSAVKFGHHLNHEFVFYTNDKSITNIEGATIKYFEVPKVTRRFVFHKPNILLQATKEFPNENLLYLDVDIILGKRFDPDKLLEGKDLKYPLCPHHTLNWDIPHRNGVMCMINEVLNPGENDKQWPPMNWEWVQTNCVMFNSSHESFLTKWKDTCYKSHEFFTGDEAVYNSLFNFKSFENLGKIHINWPYVEAFPGADNLFWNLVRDFEEEENKSYTYEDLKCFCTPNTSNIMFYHGCQDLDQLKRFNMVQPKIKDQINKVNLVFSTARRIDLFKSTFNTLVKFNPNISSLINKVYILDDRSSEKDRTIIRSLVSNYFPNKVHLITFDNNHPFGYVEKLNFLKFLAPEAEYTLFLEEDWDSIASLNLKEHIDYLDSHLNIDQIIFSEHFSFQDEDVKNKTSINQEYWDHSKVRFFKHTYDFLIGEDGMYYYKWCVVKPIFTLNPTLNRNSLYQKGTFPLARNYESNFSSQVNAKQILTKQARFVHTGANNSAEGSNWGS